MAWLIGVARHKLVDHWRAQARNDRKLALAHSSEPTAPGRGVGGDRSRLGGGGVGGSQPDLPGGVGVASRRRAQRGGGRRLSGPLRGGHRAGARAGPERRSAPSTRDRPMSDDLDLRGIDQRHEPDPQFRAALRPPDGGDRGGHRSGLGDRDAGHRDDRPRTDTATIWAEATQPPSHPWRPRHRRRRGGRDARGGDLPRRHDRTGRHPDPHGDRQRMGRLRRVGRGSVTATSIWFGKAPTLGASPGLTPTQPTRSVRRSRPTASRLSFGQAAGDTRRRAITTLPSSSPT